MERCQSAELDGYVFDCMQHPKQRKRKLGCLSGVSKAGNYWFTLSREAQLEKLCLKHTQISIPTLIGPFQCSFKAIKLSGSQNFA